MSNIKQGDLVAVYGSLRSGLGNHRVIENADRQEDGVVSGIFKMFSLTSFPALVKDTEPSDIVVEIYKVDSEITSKGLDRLEGYPSFYNREVVTLVDGRECWVYFIESKCNVWPEVYSGDWKEYLGC